MRVVVHTLIPVITVTKDQVQGIFMPAIDIGGTPILP
mgnify:CR=1 FL=1